MGRSSVECAFALVIPYVLFAAGARAPRSATGRGLLLVTNKGEHTLSIVDPDAGRQLAVVPEGGVTGHEVAASPDGRFAYVPIYGDSGVGRPGSNGQTLTVIDIGKREAVGTIDFGRPVRPHAAVFGPRNGLLYVTTELTKSVDVIDPKTLKVLYQVPTGQPESHMLAITHDGRRGYTANVGAGTVSALDLEARKTLAVIPISRETQRISLSVDDRWVFTADQTQPRLAVIDTATNKVKTWVALPSVAFGTRATLDGRWLLVCLPHTNQVAVVDLSEMKVARTIDVPKAPQEILVRPDDTVAYVSCDASRQIVALNLKTWQIEKTIDVGRGADGMAWAATH